MKQNLIIRASAGTGKTFALATRFIRLMLFQDVTPSRIMALTFSRAAAQEIYMKLLERLWTAALTEAGAERERETLLQGLDDAERRSVANADWSPRRFAELLRRVITSQHQGAIATLDSFILRVVRSFPLELGFQHAVDVLDTYGEKTALAEAQKTLLKGSDAEGSFASAFKTATNGKFVRACANALGKALMGWRDFMLTHPESRTWTTESICRALGVDPTDGARPATDILPTTGKRYDPFDAIVKKLQTYDGQGKIFGKTIADNLMRHLIAHPDATEYTHSTDKKGDKTISCSPEAAERIREIARYLVSVKIRRAAQLVEAKLALCQLIESEYDVSTRRRGLLTFADFTDCQAVAEQDSDLALKLENLQFRFDSRFDHWALDEFQDTSELQWLCLRRLVREAAQPDANRSVMAVGDLKQSIYTWRGGNDAPFKEIMGWREFTGEWGEIVPNDISYRYEKHTADFINRVFGPSNLRESGLLPPACQPAIDRWLKDDCWMEHRADSRNGIEKANDFVEVFAVKDDPRSASDGDAEDDSSSAPMRKLAPSLCARVADLWAEHEAAGSTDTVGILVRNNNDGRILAERLRSWGNGGLPVVWEGASGVLDATIVRAVLELLKLAEFPEDTFAWKTVNVLFPIREIVFPSVTHVGAVSLNVSRMLTQLGLSRTLREITGKIVASPVFRPDARSCLRLESLVRAAVAYEGRRETTGGVLKFVDYLATTAGRETSASSHVIRILTIHRSKGLTLDHVFVPILEASRSDPITCPREGTPLSGEGWVIGALPEEEARLLEPLSAAWQNAANEMVLVQLRLNYVALTRARKSTHVFICDDGGNGVRFRDLVKRPFADDPQTEGPYGRRICALGTMPSFGRKLETMSVRTCWQHAAGQKTIIRRSPSEFGGGSLPFGRTSVSSLFADGRETAAEKGSQAHARYAQVEWIDPQTPKDEVEARIVGSEWAEAFVRTPETVALWRERSYELFVDGAWESGQFDRVVFTEREGVRHATVYDFKTNAKRENESTEAFAQRLQQQYARQLEAYRRAVSRLTAIPLENIRTCLLTLAGMEGKMIYYPLRAESPE